jgi:hypothetical protein
MCKKIVGTPVIKQPHGAKEQKMSAFTGNEISTIVLKSPSGRCGSVQYHQTVVLEVTAPAPDYRIVQVDAGGWHTATTRKRINQGFVEFDIPAHAYIKGGQLFVEIDSDADAVLAVRDDVGARWVVPNRE